MKTALRWGLALAFLVLVSLGALWAYRAHRLAAQLRTERIAAANLLAAKDTTLVAVKRDGDRQIQVARRLAFQERVALAEYFTDSISRLTDSLELVGKAAANLAIEAAELRAERAGAAAVVDTAGNLVAADTLDAADTLGVTVSAEVTIPLLRSAPTSWRWELARAEIPLTFTLHCEGPYAVSQLAGPTWAALRIDSVVQDERICHPPVARTWRPFALELPSLPVAALLVVGGVVVGRGF